jgi:hypothetical protein
MPENTYLQPSSLYKCGYTSNYEAVLCYRVGAGYSHSLFIVRNQTEQDKKEIEKFPVLDQSKMD